jgi:hypothetical protein
MLHGEAFGLLVGAVALGAVHGVEPGHGWPVAASYALDQANKWVYGLAASLIIGVGHLVSSIAMVAAFFYVKSQFNLTQVTEPVQLSGTLVIGGPVGIAAGVLLIILGVREFRHGHSHGKPHDEHDHESADQRQTPGEERGHHRHDHTHHGAGRSHGHAGHSHDHSHGNGGVFSRLKERIPFVGGHSQPHDLTDAADRGLLGIAWFAFLLGFAHEEEFEIIALCAGSDICLELMSAYALTVIVGIVGLTMLLIAGYEHFEEVVEQYTPYLPAFSATVLILLGVGFITGLL